MQQVLGELLGAASQINGSGGVLGVDQRLHTWSQLDEAAARIASALVSLGVKKGDRVAVLHPKSVRSFLAVHAILRCGAVMVPLDPLGPVDSVQSVLRYCSPAAIIGDAKTVATRAPDFVRDHSLPLLLSGPASDIAALDVPADRTTTFDEALSSHEEPLPAVEPDDLAYIIFTSGSTGEPKGIAHTHRSALAYAKNACDMHGLRPTDRVAGTSPLHFDMSTLELYAAPAAGATCVTVTEGQLRFPASLSQRFEEGAVTILYAVPYQLRQLCIRGDIGNKKLETLRQISFGGEQFAPGVLKEIAETLPPAELLNVYGPAEVNGVISHAWPPRPRELTSVPIGQAWADVSLRVVNEDLVDVVDGDSGELLVASASQMVGYRQRPELNASCFLELDGIRWYRTGDIVRRDVDGNFFFLGRADSRVKVRGVRLELETIEAVLSDAPGVDSAVAGVSTIEGDVERVVAWVLPDGMDEPEVIALRRWCAARLPDAAVPGEIRFVESFAQSRTGKIDRRALRLTLGDQSTTVGKA